jgi:hypothetical protein
MFTVTTNRGSCLGVFDNQVEALAVANEVNCKGNSTFAFITEVDAKTAKAFAGEDMPGRGFIYG